MNIKVNVKVLSVMLMLCMVVALFPVTVYAADGNYVREIIYADATLENFAFEPSDDVTVPIGVFINGGSYRLGEEDTGAIIANNTILTVGDSIGENVDFGLFGSTSVNYSGLTAASRVNEIADLNGNGIIESNEVVNAIYPYIEHIEETYALSPTDSSVTMAGDFFYVSVGNGKTWTIPDGETLCIHRSLDVAGGTLDGTGELLIEQTSATVMGITLYYADGTTEWTPDVSSEDHPYVPFTLQDGKWVTDPNEGDDVGNPDDRVLDVDSEDYTVQGEEEYENVTVRDGRTIDIPYESRLIVRMNLTLEGASALTGAGILQIDDSLTLNGITLYSSYENAEVNTVWTPDGNDNTQWFDFAYDAANGIWVQIQNSVPDQSHISGDVNQNGNIDSGDYLMTKGNCLGLVELSSEQQAFADANSDYTVDSADALLIKQMLLGIKS